jgi:hypothetical protein
MMQARKAELTNAEGLFGLDQTEYPELTRVAAELKKLSRVYSLYAEQKEFEEIQVLAYTIYYSIYL